MRSPSCSTRNLLNLSSLNRATSLVSGGLQVHEPVCAWGAAGMGKLERKTYEPQKVVEWCICSSVARIHKRLWRDVDTPDAANANGHGVRHRNGRTAAERGFVSSGHYGTERIGRSESTCICFERHANRGLRAIERLANVAGHQHDPRGHVHKCNGDAGESADRIPERESAGAADHQHAERDHITPSDADAFIDDFVAGVVTVNVSGNSFVIQGPHGHQFTVNVNGQTEWEGNETINNLTSTSIVEVSGTLDRTTATFLADSVGILSQDKFFAGGLVTFVNPPTNTATDFDLYVRSVLPSGTGFTPGQISTIDLTGSEMFFIYWMHNSWTNHFFNAGLMVPGQHVSIGGPFVGGAVTVKRVVLRHEGHTGTLVANSVNLGASTFQFNSNGLAGVLFNGPVTVYISPFTRFGGGLTGLSSLSSNPTNPLRVVGLVLKDPISGQPVFVARHVEELPN